MNTKTAIEMGSSITRLLKPVHLKALRLLDQQLWCLGRDVAHPANFLLRYGFERRRPEQREAGSSEYIWQDAEGWRVTCWGYGIHFADPNNAGCFLRRYTFAPRWTKPGFFPNARWTVHAWKSTRGPQTGTETVEVLTRLVEGTQWLANYEAWVNTEAPKGYRADCIERWSKEASVPADEMASAWQELAAYFNEIKEGLIL